MKKLQLPALLLLFFAVACKKSIEPIESILIGKWTYTEQYISNGVSGEWRPVTPKETIEFKPDGTFIPSESFLKDANHFEIVDSVTVKFHPGLSGVVFMRYSIDTVAGELLMAPIPNCIEGCASKFKR